MMIASHPSWRVPNTTELASIPIEALPPLAYGLSRPWLRAWQDATSAPITISLRKIADLWNIPYDHVRKMHNGYYHPARRPALVYLRSLADALAPAGIPYEEILLASAGILLGAPATEQVLTGAPERTFIERALRWLGTQEWQASGLFRQQLIALLEDEQTAHQAPLTLARSAAFIIACWRLALAQAHIAQSLDDLAQVL